MTEQAGMVGMERRHPGIEMGKLIQSVDTLAEHVTELRADVKLITEWMNQAKGARRVIAWSASSIGGVVGAAITWAVQHIGVK